MVSLACPTDSFMSVKRTAGSKPRWSDEDTQGVNLEIDRIVWMTRLSFFYWPLQSRHPSRLSSEDPPKGTGHFCIPNHCARRCTRTLAWYYLYIYIAQYQGSVLSTAYTVPRSFVWWLIVANTVSPTLALQIVSLACPNSCLTSGVTYKNHWRLNHLINYQLVGYWPDRMPQYVFLPHMLVMSCTCKFLSQKPNVDLIG
jgi:hypothetical protein